MLYWTVVFIGIEVIVVFIWTVVDNVFFVVVVDDRVVVRVVLGEDNVVLLEAMEASFTEAELSRTQSQSVL